MPHGYNKTASAVRRIMMVRLSSQKTSRLRSAEPNMNAADVVDLYSDLVANGVEACVVGGWGVDALVGSQTRQHKDLDLLLADREAEAFWHVMRRRGYRVEVLWQENLWLDGRPTAFVAADCRRREVDVHVFRTDARGPTPLWHAERTLASDALSARGLIAGVSVRCMTVEMQIKAHSDYELPQSHQQDLALLMQLG
ncbi:MAG: nucleotidyltransferase domain-containing protein [Nocardioidaceae bacterium]